MFPVCRAKDLLTQSRLPSEEGTPQHGFARERQLQVLHQEKNACLFKICEVLQSFEWLTTCWAKWRVSVADLVRTKLTFFAALAASCPSRELPRPSVPFPHTGLCRSLHSFARYSSRITRRKDISPSDISTEIFKTRYVDGLPWIRGER